MQFYDVKQSKIRWMVIEIKFIKDEKFLKIWEMINLKSGKIHKNWEKFCNLMVLSIKNLKRYIKIEKKICNFMV